MNKIYFLLIALLLCSSTITYAGQDYNINVLDSKNNLLEIKNANTTDALAILDIVKEYYGLENSESFLLEKENRDKLGIRHYRYFQMHNGVKVKGAQLFIHIYNNGIVKVTSHLVHGINYPNQAVFIENDALQKATDFINADEYYWEDPEMEAMIKDIKNDQMATFYPKGELLYAANKFSQDGSEYELLWKFDIYAKGEKSRTYVYVNALSGEISFSRDAIQTVSVDGVAHTRYHGIRDIKSDSLGENSYRLFDDTRGDGIHTVNIQESYDTSEEGPFVEFTDIDNVWDNANANKDEVAGDVHWSLEMTYDYYLTMHDLNSYNNNGIEIVGKVHWGENEFNANWNGYSVNFGDGSPHPLTSIDVVGHELAHAVTQYSADLDYAYEYGALNESFSDIFGTAIEFWAVEDSLKDWKMGMANFEFRNLSDPNEEANPDTYKGDFWQFETSDPPSGANDNHGVHNNSGVQNFWYYLLSEGGSGINDNGDFYELDGLGLDTAAKIAFRSLTVYLGQTSDYEEAYLESVQSAMDLYGECSEPVRQVIKAWYAVGVADINDMSKDLSVKSVSLPGSSCYLSENESADIGIRFQNVGCSDDLESGTVITVSYRLNEEDPVSEEITLTEDMVSGDTLFYTITNMDLSAFGKYYIDVWASIDEDLIYMNDTAYNQEVLHQVQLASEDIVGFESLSASPDSFYVEIGEHGEAKISTVAEYSGSRGFKMTGVDVDAEIIELPNDEEDNFDWNPEFNTKICFCVDATDWDYVKLAFEMKQLYSLYWEELYGDNMSEYVSSMRILVNDEQIGDQYHPTTETDDPYTTYMVDLDDYAGEIFEVCFESKAFIRNAEDPVSGSDGDNVFLDNVRFIDAIALSVEEEKSDKNFLVYPNPNSGSFSIELIDINADYTISIVDALGRTVYEITDSSKKGNLHTVNISDYTKGIYIVKVQFADEVLTKRIILN